MVEHVEPRPLTHFIRYSNIDAYLRRLLISMSGPQDLKPHKLAKDRRMLSVRGGSLLQLIR